MTDDLRAVATEQTRRLQACPFCGFDAPTVARSDDNAPTYYVSCSSCGAASGLGGSVFDAGERWNRRALLARPDRMPMCGYVSLSGPNREPLACGYAPHDSGPHSWATLPTFPLADALADFQKEMRENVIPEIERVILERARIAAETRHLPLFARPVEELKDAESLELQIDRLAQFIIAEVPDEPSLSQGAIDTAIRVIRRLQAAPPSLRALSARPLPMPTFEQWWDSSAVPDDPSMETYYEIAERAWNAALLARPVTVSAVDAVSLAQRFHETYERLAPQFAYTAREFTRLFDPESKNGRLMVAVCAELLASPVLKRVAKVTAPAKIE